MFHNEYYLGYRKNCFCRLFRSNICLYFGILVAKLQQNSESETKIDVAILKKDVAKMKRTEKQDVTRMRVRPASDAFQLFFYERDAIKSVGELPMNFTKLR